MPSCEKYTEKRFKKAGIQVRKNVAVERLSADEASLVDGSTLPFGLAVWAAGVQPVSLINQLNLAKNERGLLCTNDFLQLPGMQNVFALGDCAAVKEKDYPQTAQLAEQQGRYVARSLKRIRSG